MQDSSNGNTYVDDSEVQLATTNASTILENMDNSPPQEPRGSHSTSSYDRGSTGSSSPEPNNTSITDDSSVVAPRVPMAWRYRQAHAETIESSTAFRAAAAYHPLHASTFHPHRKDYFKTSHAIRSLGPYAQADSSKSPKTVYTIKVEKDGTRTLPSRRITSSPGPGISTSFYRLKKPVIPRSINGRDAPPTPRSTRQETISMGSQFSPAALDRNDGVEYASVGHFSPFSASATQWRPPGFFPVSSLPPPFIHSQPPLMGLYSCAEPLKSNCGAACCSGSFIVLWLIVAVIALGVIIGVAVIFGRRNALS